MVDLEDVGGKPNPKSGLYLMIKTQHIYDLMVAVIKYHIISTLKKKYHIISHDILAYTIASVNAKYVA